MCPHSLLLPSLVLSSVTVSSRKPGPPGTQEGGGLRVGWGGGVRASGQRPNLPPNFRFRKWFLRGWTALHLPNLCHPAEGAVQPRETDRCQEPGARGAHTSLTHPKHVPPGGPRFTTVHCSAVCPVCPSLALSQCLCLHLPFPASLIRGPADRPACALGPGTFWPLQDSQLPLVGATLLRGLSSGVGAGPCPPIGLCHPQPASNPRRPQSAVGAVPSCWVSQGPEQGVSWPSSSLQLPPGRLGAG